MTSLRSELVAAHNAAQTLSLQKKEHFEGAADDMRRHQLAKEEEVSKNLMLEEYISRLEHDASIALKKLSATEKDNVLNARKQSLALDKLVAEKNEAEARSRQAQDAVQEGAERIKTLQQAVQELQGALSDLGSKQSASRQDVDSKVGQLSAQLARATEERDAESRRSDSLADKTNALAGELQRCRADMGAAAAQIDALRRENQDILQKQQQALSSAGGATQQYHAQFKQTQELLKVACVCATVWLHSFSVVFLQTVQAQRAELQAQNISLRNELNQVYSNTQGAGSSSGRR